MLGWAKLGPSLRLGWIRLGLALTSLGLDNVSNSRLGLDKLS